MVGLHFLINRFSIKTNIFYHYSYLSKAIPATMLIVSIEMPETSIGVDITHISHPVFKIIYLYKLMIIKHLTHLKKKYV